VELNGSIIQKILLKKNVSDQIKLLLMDGLEVKEKRLIILVLTSIRSLYDGGEI
jgi:hypothetical protein